MYKLTTSITDCMSAFISPPQGGYCSCTVLTGDDNRGIPFLCLKGIDIDGNWFSLSFNTAMASALSLHHIELGALGHAVIVCRASVTSFSATGAVTAAAAWTGA